MSWWDQKTFGSAGQHFTRKEHARMLLSVLRVFAVIVLLIVEVSWVVAEHVQQDCQCADDTGKKEP